MAANVSSPNVVNIADLRLLAKISLPKMVFDYIDSGADREQTLSQNCSAFNEIFFRQRCAVAIPSVGVMDMLRYTKFTIGWAWAVEYGNPNESEKMFNYIYKYSPLHNIRKNGNYPAVMVITADHDDRVVPAHSFKYIATLQNLNKENINPLLIRIDTEAGHGAGMPTLKKINKEIL